MGSSGTSSKVAPDFDGYLEYRPSRPAVEAARQGGAIEELF
jgi:hypothetical protein